MKLFLYLFLFFFLNCQSQVVGSHSASKGKEIQFEDKYHYLLSLTQKDFLIINSQEKMDEVFTLINQKNENRYSPVPAVVENETYIIIKPQLKSSNDISIENIKLYKNILYVKVKDFYNPDFNENSRISPQILLKLSDKISFKKVIIKH